MASRVAIIVLNYNRKELLATCLDACQKLAGGGERPHLACFDNGSMDGSAELVRARFPAVELMTSDRNLGFAAAYNRAIAAVDSEWVALLNNDAVPDVNWIGAALEVADRTGSPCIGSRMVKDGGTRVDFVGSSMNFYGHGFHPHFDEPSAELGEEGPMLFACAGAMVCRREVFLTAGGFDEGYFAYFEDVDLGWRLNVLGHEVMYAPHSVVEHAHSATSSGLPDHQRLAWLERNGLRSLVKNYDEARLARVLPVAMALLVKRAELDSAIAPGGYFLETAAAPTRSSRVRTQLGRVLARLGGLPAGAGYDAMHRIGFSRIAALEAVSADAAGLDQRRRAVQGARRRSDDSIVKLFRDTYKPSFPHPEIKRLQDTLVDVFELEKVL